MNLINFIQDKFVNRIRQFGIVPAILQLLAIPFRPVIRISRDVILAIPEHDPELYQNNYSEILPLNSTMVIEAKIRGDIDNDLAEKMNNFLKDGCIGYFAYSKNKLAGYGFIQQNGSYKLNNNVCFKIPDNIMILKNLHVFSEYRGKSIAKKLIYKRISVIPSGYVPVSFVMVENKYSIRNLKLIGFREIAIVRIITWFNRWKKTQIILLQNNHIVQHIIEGFKSNINGKYIVFKNDYDKITNSAEKI